MSKARDRILKTAMIALGAALLLPGALYAGPTDISTEPLATPAANVPPNIMLLLDDSGSMVQQYTPDYLGRNRFTDSNRLCLDSLNDGSSSSIGTDLDNCEAGDPPLMSPDVNTQYYNPEVRYYPAVNYDGTTKTSMDAASTSNWTSVPTDGVSATGMNDFRKDTYGMNSQNGGSVVFNSNLATGYPDHVWCDSKSATATDTTHCKTNSAYTYPDLTYGYGVTTGGAVKFKTGAPYYYRLLPTEYCTDATLITCTAATAPTGLYTVPAPVRYCDSTTLTNCKAKYQGSYTRPKFTGIVLSGGASTTPATATGRITVRNPQGDSYSGSISAINVFDGTTTTNLITAPVLATGPINVNATAAIIAASISAGGSGYTACAGSGCTPAVSSNVVTITAPASGALYNGYTVTVVSPGTPVSSASITFDISSVSNGDRFNSITVQAVSLLSSTVTCNTSSGCPSGGTARNNWMGNAVRDAINSGTGSHGFTASTANGGSRLTIYGPVSAGGALNGVSLSETDSGVTVSNSPNSPYGWTFHGGAASGDIETTSVDFSGGVDASYGRAQVGNFVRTNIVSGQTYTKYPARTDCAGATCTYAEEMTNFANWYAYYRERDTMAKTAIGRAFLTITANYRVGFITINPGDPVQSNRYLKVDDFAAGAGNQKNQWYDHLYSTTSNGGTPLREALSRVGRYFAGVTNGINDGMDGSPIEFSCQPNFTLAMTDGYWNGNSGDDLNGSSIGNQDNVNSGYSTRAVGAYDGGTPVASNTLADVAMYYYKTDLRTDLDDHVPPVGNDNAPHQHMSTFTVGLGLAGQLNYIPNYDSVNSGDFYNIKQGGTGANWPVPAADSETALDDLWHAAVNGRGKFFSAKDPVELANGITETLNAVQTRVGAGASAAASTPVPVAGDNFSFAAEYKTVEWTGDVKAYTIDLTTADTSTHELWSAKALLDQRTAADRRIYTYDSTDTTPPGTGNGNKLKFFCWPGAAASGLYPACTGDAELSAADMAYFDPLTLPQAIGWPTDGSGRDVSASAQKLVDYLRGDTANEATTGSGPADLFRRRTDLLGDIVNAQPAYLKASPFSYNIGTTYAGTDPFYQEYRQTTDGTSGTRKGTVFVASNDGMLHAFETDPDNNPYYQTAGISTAIQSDDSFTGTLNPNPVSGEGAERWAYIPGLALPQLKQLANSPYSHRYFVDGTPVIGDVCFGHTTSTPCAAQSSWHSILVAGLNSGGRGYYALDISDPDNPKALWEFKGGSGTTCLTAAQANSGTYFADCNLGLTYGNPQIVKRKSDGKWVVIVSSGYNNISPGDGQGHLYILDAETGAILNRVDTGVGCNGTSSTSPCTIGTIDPSGLGKINSWVDNADFNNTALRVYAGDLKGNLWRIQLDPGATGYMTAFRLTTLTDPGGTAQPITVKPELGEVQGFAVIYVGTGKYLGTTDTTDTQVQSIYAIRDDLTSTTLSVRSGGSGFVQQSLSTVDSATRTATSNAVDFNTNKGWFIDLPDPGERVNVAPTLQLGTLTIASNVPSDDSCVAGGYGYTNYLDARSGSYVVGATANMASTKVSASLIVGFNVIKTADGGLHTSETLADNTHPTLPNPIAPLTVTGRRVSWRELTR